MYIHLYVYNHGYIYVCMYIYTWTSNVYIYIYIYYISIYIYIYVYIVWYSGGPGIYIYIRTSNVYIFQNTYSPFFTKATCNYWGGRAISQLRGQAELHRVGKERHVSTSAGASLKWASGWMYKTGYSTSRSANMTSNCNLRHADWHANFRRCFLWAAGAT